MKNSIFARLARQEAGAPPLEPSGKDDFIGRFMQAASALSWKAKDVAETAQDKDARRQRQRRAKQIKTCEVRFDGTSISGIVLNLCEGGAELRLPEHQSELPERFSLRLSPDRIYDCVICWRDRNKVGVSFV